MSMFSRAPEGRLSRSQGRRPWTKAHPRPYPATVFPTTVFPELRDDSRKGEGACRLAFVSDPVSPFSIPDDGGERLQPLRCWRDGQLTP